VPADEWEEEAISVLSQFKGPGAWRDALVLAEPVADESRPWRRRWHSQCLLLGNQRARLWSLGESLTLLAVAAPCATTAARGHEARMAELLEQLQARLMPGCGGEAEFPRHAMHAAEALARYISWRRASTRKEK
jgi:hypothetical protein